MGTRTSPAGEADEPALRKLTSAVNRSHTCVIFTNQLREKIG